jgi:transcriptional regulator with XRE-family HTH domain
MTDDETLFFQKLGQRLAELRRERDLTQAQLAEQLGVSQQTVNSFERGRRRVPVSLLPELALILDSSIEDLIGSAKGAPAKRGPASKIQRQMEEIRRLPRSKQKFVIDMLDAVLAQAQRSTEA